MKFRYNKLKRQSPSAIVRLAIKLLIIFFFGLINIALASDFDCTPTQEIKWEKLSAGVEWTKYDLAFTPYLKENHNWELTKSRSVTVRAFKINTAQTKNWPALLRPRDISIN